MDECERNGRETVMRNGGRGGDGERRKGDGKNFWKESAKEEKTCSKEINS